MALHEKFQEWNRIRQLDIFVSLCHTRRPPKVTNALAEAIYRTAILPSERADDPSRAFLLFRRDLLPYMGNLFDICPTKVTPGAGKAFLLAAGCTAPPDRNLADRLVEMLVDWPEHDARFFRRILEHGFRATDSSPRVESFSITRYQDEIEVLRSESDPPILSRARAGLIAARQINTLEAFQVLIAYIGRLQAVDRDDLLGNPFNRADYERIVQLAGGQLLPNSWTEWISSLDTVQLSTSHDFVNIAVSEWQVHEHLRDNQDIADLVKAIEAVPASSQERLLDTLPHLVQWLQGDAFWPENTMRSLYRAIYDHLMLQLSSRWWREAVGVARELLDGMLQLGVDEAEYTQLLNDLGDVIPVEVGKSDVDALFEIAELSATYASPNPDARQTLWARIIASLNPVRSALSARELAQINDLGQVFGIDEVFPPPDIREKPVRPGALDGRMVAIHSLAESAAQRAGRLLGELYPGVRVRISHDRVGSARLADLARRADVFVVCWRAATHAATEAIERIRPINSVTLYPPGKGSSSILRAIEERYPA